MATSVQYSQPIMKKPAQPTDLQLSVVAVACTAGTFALDILFPLGVAAPMAYVAPVLISLWASRRRFTYLAGGGGTVLTILGYLISPLDGVVWIGLLNRALALCMIWITGGLVLLHKQAKEDINTLRRWLPMCASCKKIRDDQGYWNGLEDYIEQHSEILFTHTICPACTEQLYPDMYPELLKRHPELFKKAD